MVATVLPVPIYLALALWLDHYEKSSDIVTRFRGAGSISGRAGLRRASFLSYVLCSTLLDNRRHQRKWRGVIRCNEGLAVNVAPIPYRGLGIE